MCGWESHCQLKCLMHALLQYASASDEAFLRQITGFSLLSSSILFLVACNWHKVSGLSFTIFTRLLRNISNFKSTHLCITLLKVAAVEGGHSQPTFIFCVSML